MTRAPASPPPLLPRAPAPVLIVGAGFLGRRVAELLPGPVIATTRSGTWGAAVPPPAHVELRALDVVRDDDARLTATLADARALVICFAAGREQAREAVYVEGTRRLLAACAGAGLQRVVYTSSTSALPDIDGWVDETCDAWPASARGRVQREGEEQLAARANAAAIPWCVLRLGGLYGPGRGVGRVYRVRPELVRPGDGMQATNLIHRDDAAHAVTRALRLAPEVSGIIHVCADDHRPRRDMYEETAKRRGAPSPRWADAPTPGRGVYGKRVRNARMRRWLRLELLHAVHALDEA